MSDLSDRVQKLRDAGLTMPALTEEAHERLASLTEAEVEALAAAARKLSSSEGPRLVYQGNFQYPGFEEW